jgi:hypothetical protein
VEDILIRDIWLFIKGDPLIQRAQTNGIHSERNINNLSVLSEMLTVFWTLNGMNNKNSKNSIDSRKKGIGI